MIEELTKNIESIYQSEEMWPETEIEKFLDKRLENEGLEQKLDIIGKLLLQFNHDSSKNDDSNTEKEIIAKMVLLLLGKDMTTESVNSSEMLKTLSFALNTLFEELNRLIHHINLTLFKQDMTDKTIRHILCSQLEGEAEDPTGLIKEYIGRIEQSFSISYRLVYICAQKAVSAVLAQLSHEHIEKKLTNKFFSSRKVESYDVIQQEIKEIKNWIEQGNLKIYLQQELEKECNQIISQEKSGGKR